jgi:hypothetical protein
VDDRGGRTAARGRLEHYHSCSLHPAAVGVTASLGHDAPAGGSVTGKRCLRPNQYPIFSNFLARNIFLFSKFLVSNLIAHGMGECSLKFSSNCYSKPFREEKINSYCLVKWQVVEKIFLASFSLARP